MHAVGFRYSVVSVVAAGVIAALPIVCALALTRVPDGPGPLAVDVRLEPDDAGVRVALVRPGSLFARFGLAAGDVVTAVDGVMVSSPAGALALVEHHQGTIEIEFIRDGHRGTLHHTLD